MHPQLPRVPSGSVLFPQHELKSSACLSALGQRESTVKRIWSLQTALKTQQIKCEVPVAQLGAGQVALAVSHFPSHFKAALLSAFHVSELLPFVQFSNCSFAASIHGF